MGIISDFLSRLEQLQLKLIGDNTVVKVIDVSQKKEETHLHVHFDLSSSSEQNIQQLRQIVPDLQKVLETSSDFSLEAPQSGETLDVVSSHLSDQNDQKAHRYVQKLPAQDVSLWLTALILRQEFGEGNQDRVQLIKRQMVEAAGRRGATIANLCNEGYLETHIIPLYKHLVEDSNQKNEFLELYEIIVSEHVFAVFVSKNVFKTAAALVTEVNKKISQVKKYGWSKVHIHAIGQSNVSMVRQAILLIQEDEDEETPIGNIEEFSDRHHIKVTLHLI